MANPRNEASVAELRELLGDVKTFFLVDYQGLSAEQIGALRRKLRDAGGRLLVAKNTLVNVVLKEQGVTGLEDQLKGPTALVLVGDDPVTPAKAVTDFSKDHPNDLPVAKGGLLQGAVIGSDALSKIAKLPARDQLLSELVGVLQAPLQQLVGVLDAAPRNLVSVMTNYSEKLKEEEHGV
ncbi:50S ribosomal protein L10 [Truepera radiovictrix]|uniref:Large ribosomal subunit protein uL10 n=1 Tax=Truepera radiovictrix (strain DSM 17093 / CIP 108686 / LMG 22925 / RQ-24) TaxID=649638 RepID=D7CTN9_TRURR|nr:50S ribosomal protein L10 [Truepera radiovictrix]ADI15586.1 ribosomal protein L10 [Truepera radiovictrix DSM 17093]WMT58785.1 50S ribosomal protein L10 [Truepera radiovictrix]